MEESLWGRIGCGLLLLCAVATCSYSIYEGDRYSADKVVMADQVLMNDVHTFTFVTFRGKEVEYFQCDGTPLITRDSDKNTAWVVYQTNHSGNCQVLKIHLLPNQKLEGGGWSHGKFGKGTTVEVR